MSILDQQETIEEPPQQDPPEQSDRPGFFQRRPGRIIAYTFIGLLASSILLFSFFYFKFARIIDARLAAGPFSKMVNVYAAPKTVMVGDAVALDDVVSGLRHSGYSTSRGNKLGWYNVRPRAVEIFPGPDAYPGSEPGVLEFNNGKIGRIIALNDNSDRHQYQLEPQFIANISDHREQRRMVRFSDIPPVLVQAVISAEDKHFFHHGGFDVFRVMKAAYVDMKDGRKEQGASTLTMQLARNIWLEPDKQWKRKAQEMLIAMHIEHKLTKQQIFEDYANQVYLGQHGTFSINGFGEAARAYFGKDLTQITVPEAALLAGVVQRPSYFNPYRYPDRARDRRNVVLTLMKENGYLTAPAYEEAVATPVHIVSEQSDSVANHYFVDLMTEELQSNLGDNEKSARSIFTTLDPDLQKAAEDAVRIGMDSVDKLLRGGKKAKPGSLPPDQPQVALVAIDPHTGEIKALVGGRNYDASQLNHALAMRQPGSAFKPFVYAAALDTAVTGGSQIFTAATVLNDSPTTFGFGNIAYAPGNFKHEYMGKVTLRTALAHSLNAAAVSLAEQVGYQRVVDLARRAGFNNGIKPTPAVALGAYEATPLELAGAYTIFANKGLRMTPSAVSLVRGADGTVLFRHDTNGMPALDPRVTYLMVNLMQETLRSGTGASARAHGFTAPAAGKTGTSRDGWFAGFTTELLCVVWVGFDDNRDLNLEGARSALPIWTEFMKRAAGMRGYRDAKQFTQPGGIVSAQICNQSGQLAGPYCPNVHAEVFIDGTEPAVQCELHSPSQADADRVVELPPGGVTSSANPGPPPATTPPSGAATPIIKKQ